MIVPIRNLTILLAVMVLSVGFAEHTGKTLRMAITQDEGTLTPYTYQTGYPGYELMTLIYDQLFLMDENLVPQPWLVSDLEISADGLSYKISLRPGITWHDGEPLTADDVAFSINYYQNNLLGRFTRSANKVTGVEVLDDLNVILSLGAPDATFLQTGLADMPMLPEHIWSSVTEPKTMAEAIGSGAYRLSEYRSDQFYRLEENPDYWGPSPAFDAIIAPIIRDQTATFQALQTGDVDVAVRTVPPELVNIFSGRSDLKVVQGPGFASTIVIMDITQGALANREVRQVVAGLINYQQLIDTLLLGYGTAGTPGFLHSASVLANPATQEYARLTPEEAMQKLTDLGFSRGSDGIYVDGEGNRLEFEFLTYSDNPIRLRASELVAQDLRAGGFAIKLLSMDGEALVQRVWPDFDVSQGRNYQMSIFGWSAPVAAQARLGSLLHSDPGLGTLNLSGYANDEVDRLTEEAAITSNDEERLELFHAVQEELANDLPLITLFYLDGIFAYRPAAHDDWVFMAGQGIINKASFLTR